MIDVIGMPEEDAKRAVIALGLTPEIDTAESTDADTGLVINASAKEGDRVRVGSNVILTVSVGAEGIVVPNLVNMTIEEAIALLVREGFTYSRTDGNDDFIAVGHVFRQSPEAETTAETGAMISLWVSTGPGEKRVAIPNLIGRTEADAQATLEDAGLTYAGATYTTHPNENLVGLVCFQSIAEGVYVEAGTSVSVEVSRGAVGALYSFMSSIAAPTLEEDPEYQPGTTIRIILATDDGTTLHDSDTTDFPYPLNISNIKSAHGILLLRYVNNTPEHTVTNDDGTVTTIEAKIESKEITREIEFTRQDD
jgi:serine/threonine-protein kinase